MIKKKIFLNKDLLIYLVLSLVFVLTVQQFLLFKGNIAHIIHSVKYLPGNNLKYDWIANQTNHLPFFAHFNHFLLFFFPKNILYVVHGFLLGLCSLFIFLICKFVFPKLENKPAYLIWFSSFIFIFHENTFFSGVAGQHVIDAGYEPASFGILFFLGIYFFLIDKIFLSAFFICLSASFHPTYVLHSGFITCGFLFYYLINKKINFFSKYFLFYFLLILPITIFIILKFLLLDSEVIKIGQEILLKRIPHHANIHQWLTYKDLFFLVTYVVSLHMIKKNKFYLPFLIFGIFSISLSVIQFFLNYKFLALAFPWRTSVFIAPLSSMIILSFLIDKINFKKGYLKLISLLCFLIFSAFFFIKSHYLKDLNAVFKKKLILAHKIKLNYNVIDQLLVPGNLDYIRLNTGIPIFIDWKHHAFKYDEIIEWRERLDLVNEFYGKKNFKDKTAVLKKIQKKEKISHILIFKHKSIIHCNSLIDDDKFMLVDAQKCFN